MRILKIETLPSKSIEWIDNDEIMIHSCFQILKNSVEKEHVDTHCNYNSHKEFVDEVRFLYNWWINKNMKKLSDDEIDYEIQMKEDDEMLFRLIKIRSSLWT